MARFVYLPGQSMIDLEQVTVVRPVNLVGPPAEWKIEFVNATGVVVGYWAFPDTLTRDDIMNRLADIIPVIRV